MSQLVAGVPISSTFVDYRIIPETIFFERMKSRMYHFGNSQTAQTIFLGKINTSIETLS